MVRLRHSGLPGEKPGETPRAKQRENGSVLRANDPGKAESQRSVLSIHMVTGPSLSNLTFMSAPKLPRATGTP